MSWRRADRDPKRPVYVISVAASIVSVHPRTLRIYEDEGLLCPARTATNIRLYSEEDVRRILWIRHLTQNRGVNLAGIRILFELEERLGTRILETLFDEANSFDDSPAEADGSGSRVGREPTADVRPQMARAGAPAGPDPAPDPRAATQRAANRPTASRPAQPSTPPARDAVGADHHWTNPGVSSAGGRSRTR